MAVLQSAEHIDPAGYDTLNVISVVTFVPWTSFTLVGAVPIETGGGAAEPEPQTTGHWS